LKLDLVTQNNFFTFINTGRKPWQKNYLAMYSSQWRGVTTDPALMMIPADDHLVHRGDGVFDVMRCIRGRIYQMEGHLARLNRSARAISLEPPAEYQRLTEIIKEVTVLGGAKDCLIRVVLSRGPGSFAVNPSDCPETQLYINVVDFKGIPEKLYQQGVSACTSTIPIKKAFFATIKSCDYLPNVLMKIDAAAKGCGYPVSLDEEGFIAEGATENIGIMTNNDMILFPDFQRTLAGTTAQRVYALAEELADEGIIRGVAFSRIRPDEACSAKEMFLTGTSINILPVVAYDGKTIGSGRPGEVIKRLSDMLLKDMTENRELLTELNWG
jgi:branched-chain amino acid aminotransferase